MQETEPKESKVRGVLFDLDGVLIDSETVYTRFWQEVDKRFPTRVEGFAMKIKGNTLTAILDTYFDKKNHPAILKMLRQQERDMRYTLFDGVIPLLENLRQRGIKTAVVTSSNDTKMENLFKQIPQLAQYIDVLVTDEDVQVSKPNPQGYLAAAVGLGLEPSECVVCEDSLAGLEAGRRAGCRVVAITGTEDTALLAPLADEILDSVAQLKV